MWPRHCQYLRLFCWPALPSTLVGRGEGGGGGSALPALNPENRLWPMLSSAFAAGSFCSLPCANQDREQP